MGNYFKTAHFSILFHDAIWWLFINFSAKTFLLRTKDSLAATLWGSVPFLPCFWRSITSLMEQVHSITWLCLSGIAKHPPFLCQFLPVAHIEHQAISNSNFWMWPAMHTCRRALTSSGPSYLEVETAALLMPRFSGPRLMVAICDDAMETLFGSSSQENCGLWL